MESGLTGLESVVVRVGGEVKRAAAPGSVRGRAGTLWRWSSSHTGVRGRRAGTPSPALHTSHSTVSVSCTPPGKTEGDGVNSNLLLKLNDLVDHTLKMKLEKSRSTKTNKNTSSASKAPLEVTQRIVFHLSLVSCHKFRFSEQVFRLTKVHLSYEAFHTLS